MPNFFDEIIHQAYHTSLLEIIGVLTALIYVYLATKSNKWCFLFGLISSCIYVYITFQYKLYFDLGINLYYVVMSFIGFYAWSKHSANKTLKINKTTPKQLFIYIIGGLAITILLASLVDRFSDASLPYLDAFTTIFSIIATVMVIRKQLENWLFWIVVDSVAAGMYFYKQLYFTALLFIIYTVIAIVGFIKWKRLIQNV